MTERPASESLLQRATNSRALHASLLALLVVSAMKAMGAFLLWRQTPWIWGLDIHGYLVGAKIGLDNGWGHIYDLALQRPRIIGIFETTTPSYWTPFASPPEVAILATPLTFLSQPLATDLWASISAACLVTATFALAPTSIVWRSLFVCLVTTSLAVVLCASSGNVGMLVASTEILAFLLLAHGRQIPAGIAVGFLIFKPQLILLVPIAMLLTGRYKFFFSFAITASFVGVLSILLIGWSGIRQYLGVLSWVSAFPGTQEWNVNAIVGQGLLTNLARVLLVVCVAMTALTFRNKSPAPPLASALIGSVLVSPYGVYPDLTMVVVACLIVLREDREPVPLILTLAIILETSLGDRPLIFFLELSLIAYILLRGISLELGLRKAPPTLVAE